MITVFGANGNTGRVVAETLLAKGKAVRVVARDEKKVADLVAKGATFARGDVEDAASVRSALEGAEGAYLLVPPQLSSDDLFARARRIGDAYAEGLARGGVRSAVFLSSVGAHLPSGTGPIATAHLVEERLAKVTGTVVTFLRAAYFMENVLNYVHPMKGDGVLPVFGGGEGYPFPMVATKDIGLTAAEMLLAPPASNGVVELEGPAPRSFADAAGIASRVLSRPVTATPLPIEGLVPALTGLGMSAHVAGLFREMTEAFGSGKVGWDGKGRHVHGKTSLEDVLAAGLG